MDKACREAGRGGSHEIGHEADPFVTAAARRVLERSEW